MYNCDKWTSLCSMADLCWLRHNKPVLFLFKFNGLNYKSKNTLSKFFRTIQNLAKGS